MTHRARAARRTPDLDPKRPTAGAAPERCRCCARPHGALLRTLPDGRWYDAADQTWRDDRGRRAAWPDVVEYAQTRDLPTDVRRVAADGGQGRPLCRRCAAAEATTHRAALARIRALMNKAVGDLFLGGYDDAGTVDRFVALVKRRRTARPGARSPRRAATRNGAPATALALG